MIAAPTGRRLRLAVYALAASTACSSAPQKEAAAPAPARDTVALSRTSQELAGIAMEVAKAESVPGALEAVGTVALDLLRRLDPARPVRLLGVRVAGLDEESAQAVADDQLTLSL